MQQSKSYVFRYSKQYMSTHGSISVRSFAASNDYDLAVIGGGPGGKKEEADDNRLCGRNQGGTERLEDCVY